MILVDYLTTPNFGNKNSACLILLRLKWGNVFKNIIE